MLSLDIPKLRKFLEDQPETYWFKLKAADIIELVDSHEKLKKALRTALSHSNCYCNDCKELTKYWWHPEAPK